MTRLEADRRKADHPVLDSTAVDVNTGIAVLEFQDQLERCLASRRFVQRNADAGDARPITVGNQLAFHVRRLLEGIVEVLCQGRPNLLLSRLDILIDKQNRARLTDFGLARPVTGPSLSVSGTVVGTPAYMSPEQAASRQVNVRSDVYSLGATLYHALSGRPPFVGKELMEILSPTRGNGRATRCITRNNGKKPWRR